MDALITAWRRGWRARNSFLAMLTIVLSLSGLGAVEEQTLEYQIKAAFLLNFTRFIEWPSSEEVNAGSPFTICIVGRDPFGPALDQIVEGETVNHRKIVVLRGRGEAPGTCAILYVSREEKNVAAILAGVGAGVLTVGESDAFLHEGGMIAFVLENRRVRFNVDLGAARKAGLKVSSRLLNVARSVR